MMSFKGSSLLKFARLFALVALWLMGVLDQVSELGIGSQHETCKMPASLQNYAKMMRRNTGPELHRTKSFHSTSREQNSVIALLIRWALGPWRVGSNVSFLVPVVSLFGYAGPKIHSPPRRRRVAADPELTFRPPSAPRTDFS